MLLDSIFPNETLVSQTPELAHTAEEMGFDGIWSADTMHNPFIQAALFAENTNKITIGTAIAVSFARSPAVMAQVAWDLAELSNGRFILGIGTQVKAHIQRRFGMEWPDSPVNKLREQIQAVRAFWDNWQNGEKLNVRGEYYKLNLMSPFFAPEPIENPNIPIYIAGVGTGLARLAGETADGYHIHPFHTPRYIKEVILPAIESGAAKTGRSLQDVTRVTSAFVVSNPQEREMARMQIAFYASTPSYRKVFALHGWEDIAEQLTQIAGRQQWEDMPALVSDEIVDTIATVADPEDLAAAVLERYQGLVDRISLYIRYVPGERDDFWRQMIAGFHKAG